MAGQVLPLPEGPVVGGFVQDSGAAMIAVTRNWGKEHETTSVLLWDGAVSTRTITVPSERARGLRVTHGRFVLTNCVSLPEFGSHCAWAHQIYELNETGSPQLDWEWDPSKESNWGPGPESISHDGTAWVAMRGDERRRDFALGRSSSPAITRTGTIQFERAEPHMPVMGLPPVFYLDAQQGIVLTPWSGGAHIVTFTDDGVQSIPYLHHEPKTTTWHEREREVAWAGLSFTWQPDETILWARRYNRDPKDSALWPETTTNRTWLAYDFRDLGPSVKLPDSPFWSIEVDTVSTSAWPHPHRGFVEVTSWHSAYRVAHSWRRPGSSKTAERHLSDCQQGDEVGRVFVSSSGRYAIAIEGETGQHHARRIELRPAPPTADPTLEDCGLHETDSKNPQ